MRSGGGPVLTNKTSADNPFHQPEGTQQQRYVQRLNDHRYQPSSPYEMQHGLPNEHHSAYEHLARQAQRASVPPAPLSPAELREARKIEGESCRVVTVRVPSEVV